MSSHGHPGLERLERRLGPRTRGRVAATALGALLGLGGVAIGLALHSITSGASYAQLVGAVALAMLLGGVPAGIGATVVGWGLGAFIVEDPSWSSVFADRDELLRWATSLLAAAVVVAVGWAMRRGHERAAVAAVEAERSRRRLEAIQELTAGLSAAVRPADVAEVLARGVVEALGARRGSFGLVEGDELVVAESGDGAGPSRSPVRVPLSIRTPLAAAAREGHVVWVERRAELVRAFPDAAGGAAAGSALAVPVRRGGVVIGGMAVDFRESGAVTLERRAVATLAAELGAQALERARLYELERLEAERNGRLQSLTAALAVSLVPADVAAIVREQGIGTAGADAVAVHLVSESGEALELEGASGVDTTSLDRVGRLPLERDSALATAFSRGRASFHPSLATLHPDDPLQPALEAEGLVSAALFPLGASRRVHGVLLLGWRTAQALAPDDRAFAGTFASQSGQALDRAIRYESERTIAETLQQSVLPQALPEVDGVTFAARYLPGEAGVDVGGDWYDAFALPDGDLAVGVGDVAGHDLSAAATMGQLRSMLRALACETGSEIPATPSDVVCRLDRVASRLDVTGFTTLAFGRVGRRAGRTVFRWANAGHPPPVLVPPDGEPELLREGVGMVLGVAPDRQRTDREVELAPGATLLLYTDGLVERRNDPDDTASAHLLDLVRRGKELPLSDLCDHLVRGTGADTGDDMVVLALRVAP